MPSIGAACIICLSDLKSPVCLPCGHAFCQACLEQVVNSIRPVTLQHRCPTCRAAYCIATPDPTDIPDFLRLHVLKPIRKLFLQPASASQVNTPSATTSHADATPCPPPALAGDPSLELTAKPSPSSAPDGPNAPPSSSELPSTTEISELRAQCTLWRQRAELHAATTLGLVGLARMTRDHALQMRQEKDRWAEKYAELARAHAELERECARERGWIVDAAAPPEEAGEPSELGSSLFPVELGSPEPVDWTSPPAGVPIRLPSLPHTPPLSHMSLSPPRSPSPAYHQATYRRRSLTPASPTSCTDCEECSNGGLCNDGSDSDTDEPPCKRWKTEESETTLARPARRSSMGAETQGKRRARQRARRALSQYLDKDTENSEGRKWLV